MIQTYEKATKIKSPKIEQIEIQTPLESEGDELLGDLNPRYFEEAMTPENALDKVYSAKVHINLIRSF